jgi:DHA1 family tetracycline resistance protein-like MFS transporter
MSVTGIVAPLLATDLFAYFTRPAARPPVPGIAFLAAGALNVLAFLLALRALARARRAAGQLSAG